MASVPLKQSRRIMPTTENTREIGSGAFAGAGVVLAKRIPPRVLPPPETLLQRQGLAYERKVVKALRARGFDLEHNPWFDHGGYVCCPDILLFEFSQNRVIVVEVKLSSTKMALAKLRKIYCPAVALATNLQALPLVITRNITHESFNDLFFNDSIYTALASHSPVYVWLGHGPIT